jgi:hypothetical protein
MHTGRKAILFLDKHAYWKEGPYCWLINMHTGRKAILLVDKHVYWKESHTVC